MSDRVDRHPAHEAAHHIAETADDLAETLDDVAAARDQMADTVGSVEPNDKRQDAQRARDFASAERAESQRLRQEWDLPPRE